MADDLDMSGKVVLVTGGGRGVGRGISEGFLARGATVMICGRTEPESLPAAGANSAAFVTGDVRDVDAVRSIIAATVERFGRLDVAVNNAGGTPPAFVAGTSPRFLSGIITLNLIAPLLVSQQANDVMQEQDDGGVIINIASVNGLNPSPGVAAYGAAKAGLLQLTQSLAIEWAPKVRVNAVTAGMVRTDDLVRLHYANDEQRVAAFAAQVPLQRLAEPADVANACLFLASTLARHMTGSNVLVHGGGDPADARPQRP
jgi:NAD(P)-dependent dehydrogenase (short-subunit alcohol dehydrogenase family)